MTTVLFFIAQLVCRHYGFDVPSNWWYILTVLHDGSVANHR